MKYEIHKTTTFAKWFNKLKDSAAKRAINVRLTRFAAGNFGDIKVITQTNRQIKEIRITVGKGYRVYFTEQGNEIILLLCGGHKSSQKTDIEKAKKILENLK